MLERIIRSCAQNRFLVFLGLAFLCFWGVWAIMNTPIDALPDLSDVQVIVKTTDPGQPPQIIEDQITWPLSAAMMSTPGARIVRGFSAPGVSFIYVIFEDGTDLYWARSRVLERLNDARASLPSTAQTEMGPDATGVGWILEYALIDRSGRHDLAELRSIQDWFLRYELKTVPNVAEVASVGGIVREYQIVPDPVKLTQYNVSIAEIIAAVKSANQERGGSMVELAEAEYMVRASGYLKDLDDFRSILLRATKDGPPVTLEDVAAIRVGPEMRRGVAELNGEGEVAGGVILLRHGQNAREVIKAVKEKLDRLRSGLPEGVEIVTTYDRSLLIDRAVDNLTQKLIEEFIVVAAICLLFLMHARSVLAAVAILPLGLFIAFIIMRYQGVAANIMSLGGVAIAVGAMVDAAIVMIENAHKKLEHWTDLHPGKPLGDEERRRLIADAAVEVGPALFISLLIITLSFIPVFAMEGQAGRMFGPLAFTKTYAMAGAALLAIVAVPALMSLCVKGRLVKEERNPVNRVLIQFYRPAIRTLLHRPKLTLFIAFLALATSLWPLSRLGGEFLPKIDEGDLLYMPSTLPGISSGEAARLLQITDKLIMAVPEVDLVFGKAGRAETATDSAPLEMLETTIRLKPKDQWRDGVTIETIIDELDSAVRLPGLANLWVPPIRTRIDMTSTGVKSPVAIKISGANGDDVEQAAIIVEKIARSVPGIISAVAERRAEGRYIDIDIDRQRAARFGMTIKDVQLYVSTAIGGEQIDKTIEGIARYPISLRYPQNLRDSPASLRALPILTPLGQNIVLADVAEISVSTGPSMIKSENARPSSWIAIDARDRDLASTIKDIGNAIEQGAKLPAGISVSFVGQHEMLEKVNNKLKLMIPATLLIIFVLLYLAFRKISEALLIMATLPFSLIGGLWLLYWQGYALSAATAVGFIALAGLAAEFGVIMLIYLRQAVKDDPDDLDRAIEAGAVLRVRPKAMTVIVISAGLAPLFFGSGAGSEVMTRIAAPMIGGMISASILSMFIVPTAYKLLLLADRRRLKRQSAP